MRLIFSMRQVILGKGSFLVFFFLLVVASCGKRIDVQLGEIEKEVELTPSSAYHRLLNIDAGELRPESRRARYALLMSLAMDKSFIDVTDDSLAQIAVKYYGSHRDSYHQMLSWYSLGRVQSNASNKPGAIVSFLRAKELAETLSEWHYYGLATRNMAVLYESCRDYDRELYYYHLSSEAFEKTHEPFYAVYSIQGQARAYMAKGHFDTADSLLLTVEAYARKESNRPLLASVLKDRAYIQMTPEKGNPREVLLLYNEVRGLGIPAKYSSDYRTLAIAHEYLGHKDSVKYYLDLAEQSAKTLLDSIHVYNTKYRIQINRHNYHEANAQIERGLDLHNKFVYNAENQQIANAISNYSHQEAVRLSDLAHYRLVLFVVSSITVFALLGVIVLVVINKKRQIREKNRIIIEKEQRIEEELALIQDISEDLQVVRGDRSEMAKTINALIGEKIAIVKICADSYESVKAEPKVNPRDPYSYLDIDPQKKKEEQMENFLTALDSFRRDEALFSVLEESVNKWRNNIMLRLRQVCSTESMAKPRFAESDFRILMLTYAGIPDRTIAFLMDMTCAAVRTRKSRYKERLVQPDIPAGEKFVQEMVFSREVNPM